MCLDVNELLIVYCYNIIKTYRMVQMLAFVGKDLTPKISTAMDCKVGIIYVMNFKEYIYTKIKNSTIYYFIK